MPLFIDTHNGTELPKDLRDLVQKRIHSGEKDDHGVIDRGILIDHDAKKMHCILEGPDRNAILEHHKTMGVPVEESTIHKGDAMLR